MRSASQAAASKEYRDDFVNAGAIAVPLRIFDEAPITLSARACLRWSAL